MVLAVVALGRDGSSRLGRSSRRRGQSGRRVVAAHEEQEGKEEAASEDVGVGGEEGEVGERTAAALGAGGLQEVLSAAADQEEEAVAAEDDPEQVEEQNVLPRNVPAPALVPATNDFHARTGSGVRNRRLFFEGDSRLPVLRPALPFQEPVPLCPGHSGAETHRKAGFLSRRSGARDLDGGLVVVVVELRPATAGSRC